MKRLAREDFSDFQPGPFPSDYFATGEYHYKPPEGYRGRWYESTKHHSWRPSSAWLVVEDDGRHRMLQALEPKMAYPRMLVTGDPYWGDYTLRVRLQPLREDGFVGVLFRYRTNRSTYRAGFEGGKTFKIIRDNHEEHEVLAEAEMAYSCDEVHEVTVDLVGDRIKVDVDGQVQLKARDETYARGRVGLVATAPGFFDLVEVTAEDKARAAFVQTREKAQRELDELREKYPKPVLWKKLETKGFGTARNLRFGHLRGDDRLDLVLAQNIKLDTAKDSLTTVRCLTAMDLDGNILWQFGEPKDDIDAALCTCDVAVQVHDIDADGYDEVICMKNFKLYILNGQDGTVKNVFPLPRNPADENRYGRLTGDSIIIANFRGTPTPQDIVVKNRYKQLWAYDNQWNLLWTRTFRNTGHFAVPYDFDGDGRDDLVVGYARIGPDGEVKWCLDLTDHTDEIAIGPFNPARNDVQIAMVSGYEGFNIVSPGGELLYREFLGHAQRVTAAKFRQDLEGLQFYVVTFWGHVGIISLHDCAGRRLLELEPAATGNVLNPVNWAGDGQELALMSGSVVHGGMLDGFGRRVVVFPDDGHPEMCSESLDLTGDGRDEICLWDKDAIWIYTQDQPFTGRKLYKPTRPPHRNASNYRGEVSLPGWEEPPGR